MTTALYRRYRPDVFSEVVGQEHVTEPLMQALRSDRVAHAYLFSGPRGCGKTTSARILARCLNCEAAPTDTPCGTCPSCVELSRGGSGSIDVVEIDAASHNGVDDARDLRERAAFAPARDRYKVFILDEAHMVTPQGFNALLKLVEEPPPHVRFIFATTEPEKVISTIRSRTHHYPFRLVPPGILTDYLATLCTAEGVTVASGVLPLVVRAGGGSVRDSLSVLDQLMAGSGPDGVTYDRAVSLLGFTDGALLDDAVDSLAATDGASLFAVIERIIQTGHEPRRFVEDLLERLRDILLLAAAGIEGAKALGRLPEDQLERMRTQARRLGLEGASRAADTVNEALTAMVGATSPRLHLELLAARLVAQAGGGKAAGEPVAAAAARPMEVAPPPPAQKAPPPSNPPAQPPSEPSPGPPNPEPQGPESTESPSEGTMVGGAADAELIRRRWPEVLGTLERRRVTWVLVSQSAQVANVEAGEVRLSFTSPQLADRFMTGNHAENVGLAIRETLGLAVSVVGIHGQVPVEGTPETPDSPPESVESTPPSIGEDLKAADDVTEPDDAAAPDADLSGPEVVARMLGGTVVED
ncbi:MAG: DNA polymerase III subunit gamma and tau [Demequinaceae bacterium]|nr:DNA polymerase III subunit gamma and tau [Demequinaceae bacterium]